MDSWELAGSALGLVVFLVWVPSMVSWIKNGVAIPRHIHILAIVLTSIGLGCLIGMMVGGLATWKLAVALTLLPLAGTYFGWFWMFGPEHSAPESS